MIKLYTTLLLITFLTPAAFANDWDKLKNKGQEVIDKNKDGAREIVADTQEGTQDIIDKNKPGTKRFLDRLQVNSERMIDDLKKGASHLTEELRQELATDEEKAKQSQEALAAQNTTVLEAETTLYTLPDATTLSAFTNSPSSEYIQFNIPRDRFYYSINGQITGENLVLNSGTTLEVAPVSEADQAVAQAIVEALNKSSAEKVCANTTAFYANNIKAETVAIHTFGKCQE